MVRLPLIFLLAILLPGCAEHPAEWVGTYAEGDDDFVTEVEKFTKEWHEDLVTLDRLRQYKLAKKRVAEESNYKLNWIDLREDGTASGQYKGKKMKSATWEYKAKKIIFQYDEPYGHYKFIFELTGRDLKREIRRPAFAKERPRVFKKYYRQKNRFSHYSLSAAKQPNP